MKKILCISLSPDVVGNSSRLVCAQAYRVAFGIGASAWGRVTNQAIAMGTQGASVLELSVLKTGTLGPAVLRTRPAEEGHGRPPQWTSGSQCTWRWRTTRPWRAARRCWTACRRRTCGACATSTCPPPSSAGGLGQAWPLRILLLLALGTTVRRGCADAPQQGDVFCVSGVRPPRPAGRQGQGGFAAAGAGQDGAQGAH